MTEGGKLCISRYPEPAVIELASIESDSDNLASLLLLQSTLKHGERGDDCNFLFQI